MSRNSFVEGLLSPVPEQIVKFRGGNFMSLALQFIFQQFNSVNSTGSDFNFFIRPSRYQLSGINAGDQRFLIL
jgi:hypothetical protein